MGIRHDCPSRWISLSTRWSSSSDQIERNAEEEQEQEEEEEKEVEEVLFPRLRASQLFLDEAIQLTQAYLHKQGALEAQQRVAESARHHVAVEGV
jgi:hypothetical protein